MALVALEEILKNFPGIDDEKRQFAENLYAEFLSGGIKQVPLSCKTLENATPLDEDEEELVKEFHAALHGGMVRDTLENSGISFTGDVLAESAKRCDALIDDPKFQALLMKL